MAMAKSTPLGAQKCPRAAREHLEDEEHEVTATENENEYECTCGEILIWVDQFHWEAAPIGA